MKITFYVLTSHNHASSIELEEAFLVFVCKLTQTVLNKSKQTLIVLDQDIQRLIDLDKRLWNQQATSFIAHDICITAQVANTNLLADNIRSIESCSAPVILTDKLPPEFDGVVLNIGNEPLNLISQVDTNPIRTEQSQIFDNPNHLLEIIPADEVMKEKGRDKYRHYQQMGYQLDVYNI